MTPKAPPRAQRSPLAQRWIALLLFCAVACGGPPPELSHARAQLRRGDLESARTSLQGLGALDGAAAEELARLQAEITSIVARRSEVDAELAECRKLEFRAARDKLKSMLAATIDPWEREKVDQELSDLADRVAENRSQPRKPAPIPVVEKLEEKPAESPEDLEAKQLELSRMQAAVAQVAQDEKESELKAELAVELPPTKVESEPEIEAPEPMASKVGSVMTLELPPEVPLRLHQALDVSEYELEIAHPDDRERAAETLRKLYPESSYFLRRALRVRWNRAGQAILDAPEFEGLTELESKVVELNARRSAAIDLIFDTGAYFYPYTVPECPKEKARTYGVVQRRVETLTAAVEEIWLDATAVRLSPEFLSHVGELAWQRQYGQDQGHYPSLPDGLRGWIFLVGEAGAEVTVQNFATRRADRAAQTYDRAVAGYNQAWWTQAKDLRFSSEGSATPQEQLQLQVTNDYRRMLGVPALAWSPLLQEAARGQAAYMDKVGKVTHTQEGDPSRRSPIDRMAFVGYNYGASENCAGGIVPPEAAHRSWQHSSAHHRNLLNPKHTELGSALVGVYWAQNFGLGREFQSELVTWQD